MSKYLKIVGVVSVIDAIAGLIAYLFWGANAQPNPFVFIIGLIAIAFFAPAIGIALYIVGDLKETLENYIVNHNNEAPDHKPNIKVNEDLEDKSNAKVYDNFKDTSFKFKLLNNKEEYYLAQATQIDSVVTIPSIYNGKRVTKIGCYAFNGCDLLENIIITNGITNIEYCAFKNCDSLKTIIIPISITFVGDGAFLGCDSLKTICYKGSKEEWEKIVIEDSFDGNSIFKNATIIYNYVEEN